MAVKELKTEKKLCLEVIYCINKQINYGKNFAVFHICMMDFYPVKTFCIRLKKL